MIQVKTQEQQATCPICSVETKKVHSHYQRTLADVSWGSLQVCIKLTTKKFFCSNHRCQRRIFTQRLPTVVLPWARRTKRLGFQLTKIGLALGGLPGSRLTRHLGIKISHQTLLRLVMKTPTPSYEVPKVLGVDDWAYRKHHTYGTILVDLEKRQAIDLLSDRTASTLAQWLEVHPGIEIISRRAKAYQKGANRGCPEATQVADRFHLLQNLAQMLEVVLNQHRKLLKNVESAINTRPKTDRDKVVDQPVPPPPPQKIAVELAAARRRDERKQKYDQAWALHEQGYSGKAIADQLAIGTTSVFRYLRTSTFPERKGRSDKECGSVSPYKKYLLAQWNCGCPDTKKLWRC